MIPHPQSLYLVPRELLLSNASPSELAGTDTCSSFREQGKTGLHLLKILGEHPKRSLTHASFARGQG